MNIHKKVSTITEEMTPGRDILGPIQVDVKTYHGLAHALLPRDWVGEYIEVVIESRKDDENAVRIRHFVTDFGHSGHIVLPTEYAGERVFVQKIGKTDKNKRLVKK